MSKKVKKLNREEKARVIYENGGVEHLGDELYIVRNGDKDYFVNNTEGFETCECPDFTYRYVACKHILAVKMFAEDNGKTEECIGSQIVKADLYARTLEDEEKEISEFMEY